MENAMTQKTEAQRIAKKAICPVCKGKVCTECQARVEAVENGIREFAEAVAEKIVGAKYPVEDDAETSTYNGGVAVALGILLREAGIGKGENGKD